MTRAHGVAVALLLCILPAGACSSFGDAPDGATVADAGSDADVGIADGATLNDGRPVGPSIEFVQVGAAKVVNDSSVTAALSTPVPAHHSIVLAISVGGGATVTSMTDTLGGSFQTVVGPTKRADGTNEYIAFAPDVPTAGIESVAVKVSPASTSLILYVQEYAGITAFEGGGGAAGGTAGTISSPIIPTTAPRALLFGFATSGVASVGTGFTARSTFDENVTEDRIVDGPGNYAAVANANGSWTMLGAIFH